jgi:hypothetical protein
MLTKILSLLSDLRSRFRRRLVSGSALERIGLLAGQFFPLYVGTIALMGSLPPQWLGTVPAEWSVGTFIEASIVTVVSSVTTHYLERRGDFSFDPAS